MAFYAAKNQEISSTAFRSATRKSMPTFTAKVRRLISPRSAPRRKWRRHQKRCWRRILLESQGKNQPAFLPEPNQWPTRKFPLQRAAAVSTNLMKSALALLVAR